MLVNASLSFQTFTRFLSAPSTSSIALFATSYMHKKSMHKISPSFSIVVMLLQPIVALSLLNCLSQQKVEL
jgi:hypothetical protein